MEMKSSGRPAPEIGQSETHRNFERGITVGE